MKTTSVCGLARGSGCGLELRPRSAWVADEDAAVLAGSAGSRKDPKSGSRQFAPFTIRNDLGVQLPKLTVGGMDRVARFPERCTFTGRVRSLSRRAIARSSGMPAPVCDDVAMVSGKAAGRFLRAAFVASTQADRSAALT